MSDDQTTNTPQAGPGWYLARNAQGQDCAFLYDGEWLRIREGDTSYFSPDCYTDFRPLGVQPAGWRELVEAVQDAEDFCDTLIDCKEPIKRLVDEAARGTLVKLRAALAAIEPTPARSE